jgi:hypothetical protein
MKPYVRTCVTAILFGALVAAGVDGSAAQPATTTSAYVPKIATDSGWRAAPGLQSTTDPGTGIPSPYSAAPSTTTPNSNPYPEATYYAKKGFGPKDHDE